MPLPALLCLCAAAALARRADHRLTGLFALHTAPRAAPGLPLPGCQGAAVKSHGHHLCQAMHFALAEINNSSTLLPNVTLGCDIHDACSEPASLHAALHALARPGARQLELLPTFRHHQPRALAIIGPDSTTLALTTAAVLGTFFIPQITYEASSEMLSLKRLYPSFLRTIPSDRQQVKAIFLLLQQFGWTWIALLGSDNAYGRDGSDALYKLLTASDVCVAYRGIIPTNQDASSPELHKLVRILVDIRVNVTVVFSNRQSSRTFFEVVVQRNVTGMVWVGSEDWSVAPAVWQVPGIQNIGSVIGMSVEKTEPAMLERFESWKTAEESAARECASSTGTGGGTGGSTQLDCTLRCTVCHSLTTAPDVSDAQVAFNVYSAVYAVAHGLHDLLGCASGACSKGTVYPWQLLQKIKQVNFTLYKSHISFDANGDIRKGYNVVMWNWSSLSWAFDVIGTFSVNPDRLSIDQGKILWHTKDCQAPPSLCSSACQPGERRLQRSRHRCCFSCVACPAGTFLNRSDLYSCQPCGADEWSPARSEVCFTRTVEFLAWSEPIAWALLSAAALLLLLTAGLAVLFALNASTPVVRAAGGRLCFLMLGALACACSSLFCYFGEPSRAGCLLRQPLFSTSFALLLSCMATRSFHLLCSFRPAARWAALLGAWQRRGGPALFIAACTAAQAGLCLAAELSGPSGPRRDYGAGPERVVLECAEGGAGRAAATAYSVLLSAGCFGLSYAGRDLPAAYSEAKCLTCGLLLHLAGSAALLCAQDALRGRARAAARALGGLCTLGALLGGFFLPRARTILLRPHRNTRQHFQAAIQRYARRRAAD